MKVYWKVAYLISFKSRYFSVILAYLIMPNKVPGKFLVGVLLSENWNNQVKIELSFASSNLGMGTPEQYINLVQIYE